jgi:hypothetical protein
MKHRLLPILTLLPIAIVISFGILKQARNAEAPLFLYLPLVGLLIIATTERVARGAAEEVYTAAFLFFVIAAGQLTVQTPIRLAAGHIMTFRPAPALIALGCCMCAFSIDARYQLYRLRLWQRSLVLACLSISASIVVGYYALSEFYMLDKFAVENALTNMALVVGGVLVFHAVWHTEKRQWLIKAALIGGSILSIGGSLL